MRIALVYMESAGPQEVNKHYIDQSNAYSVNPNMQTYIHISFTSSLTKFRHRLDNRLLFVDQ